MATVSLSWRECLLSGSTKKSRKHLSHGEKVEDIEIKFYLTVIKPLHAKWLMKFYHHITSEKDSEIIINSWKRSGIYDVVKNGSSSSPSIDPFNEIAPLVVTEKWNETDVTINQFSSLTESFVNDLYDEESYCSIGKMKMISKGVHLILSLWMMSNFSNLTYCNMHNIILII